jgi:hypothetical protein
MRERSGVTKREMKSARYIYVVYPRLLLQLLRLANDIGRIDFVGPSSMAEILRHRLSELCEFTKRKSNPDRTALNSLELEFVDS